MAIPPLARPVHIGKCLAKNRFVIQPMECGDSDLRGGFSQNTRTRYENLFRGGAGMIVMESVTLQYDCRCRRHQLLLDVHDQDNRDQWEDFVREKKRRYPDTLLIVQLNHSGELADESFSRRVCVKPLPGYGGVLLEEDDIAEIIASYAEACRFLAYIGVDGVDLKFCHGYLGAQLLRPYNDRRWKYGGSFENRARFAYEMCERVRYAVPHESFLLGAKVSVYDELPGGQGHAGPDSPIIDPEESVRFCKGLEHRGVSFIIETLGSAGFGWNLMCPNRNAPDNVFRHMTAAKLLRKNLRSETTVICGGLSLLRDGTHNGMTGVDPAHGNLFYYGNTCIERGDFDMIALGRQSYADPALPAKYLSGKTDTINWCRCCPGCGTLLMNQQPTGCVVYNPPYAERYRTLKADKSMADRSS